MYPWDRVDPVYDSTLRMIHECFARGHMTAIATTNNLTIRDSITSAFCDVVDKTTTKTKSPTSFYRHVKFKRIQLPLSGFDVIVMRDNPPIDNIALNFLDSVRNDAFIMNDIDGLRLANNKLYTASFQDVINTYVPVTHVSKNKDYLERIFNESTTKKMILKPLNGFGGHGVIVIEKSAKASFRSLIDFYIGDKNSSGNYVILQEYVEGAEGGDVRILMLNGKAIGAYKRVPSDNDIRANMSAGGKSVKHVLSKQEKELCRFIGPKLVRDGLYFAGIDVIGGKLIEVNVLSPGGITRINKLNRVKLQAKVIDFVENIVSSKQALINRKNVLSKVIDDAEAF